MINPQWPEHGFKVVRATEVLLYILIYYRGTWGYTLHELVNIMRDCVLSNCFHYNIVQLLVYYMCTIVSKQRMKIRAEFITSVLCVYKITLRYFSILWLIYRV